MSIRSRIQDGAGTTTKATVFEHRLRELEVQQPLTNYVSTSQLGGNTGTFTLSNYISISATAPILGILGIINNDPINLLVLDRVYIQILTSSVTLPNKNITAGLTITTSGTAPIAPNLPLLNENRFRRISSAFTVNGQITAILLDSTTVIPWKLGDVIDIILPGSNAIILSGGPTILTTRTINSVSVVVNVASGTWTSFVYAYMRFMMVPPENIG